jgi:hypothetical protein
MVNRDMEEDILYRSVGLKAWWHRRFNRKSIGTFFDVAVFGVLVGVTFTGLAFSLGALLVLAWKLWPLT